MDIIDKYKLLKTLDSIENIQDFVGNNLEELEDYFLNNSFLCENLFIANDFLNNIEHYLISKIRDL